MPVPITPILETLRGSASTAGAGRVVSHDLGAVGRGVGVDAAAGLAAEQASRDVLLEQRGRRVPVVARLRVHRLEDLVGGVEADQVEQRQRAHRVAAAEAHGRIDVLAGGVAALVHPDRVVEVAEQQRVGDEAGPVPRRGRLLLDLGDELLGAGDHRRVGDHGLDDLDETHHRRRVEPVQPDDARGATGAGGQLGDRQRGGVGGQHRLRREQPVELGEELLLELHPLRDGLDDQLAVLDRLERGAERDPAHQRGDVVLGQLAAGDRTAGRVGDVPLGSLEALVVVLDAHDLDPGAGEHLGDARSHRAQSDDTDPAERHARLLWMCFRKSLRTGWARWTPAPSGPRSPPARR